MQIIRKRFVLFVLCLGLSFFLPDIPRHGTELHFGLVSAQADDEGMVRVRRTLNKLKGAMKSLNDFDELEKAGMPKKDVDRMRRAMEKKIQNMMNDAIRAITEL